MEALIEQFKIWLIANSQKPNTVKAYVKIIRAFLTVTGIADPKTINESIIFEYFAKLQGRLSQASINLHRATLKSFLEFQNMYVRLPKSKTPPKREVKIVTEDEFEYQVLPMVDREFSDALRAKAVLSFLYYAGLRIEDASRVKRSQINLEKNYATVFISKQNIEKSILIPIRLKDILIKYFASEAEENGAFNMTVGQMEGIFRRLQPMLPELGLHPHKFRKSCATNANRMGMTLEQIQEMLGHKNIATTQIYVQPPTFDEIRKRYLELEKEKIRKLRKGKDDKPHE